MKYDLDVSTVHDNTSHAQVVDLVGTGHRVLDVGCSTGGLARALKTRSNVVSGIELDPEAGRSAEPDLEKLVIGDIESMDLLEHFDAGSFDVIVFADVLEHLRDPIRVLGASLVLLAPGGSVVVSLPNVAHGSVRLALLEGRFEYRPLGLLDDTHLRFFTRRSVEELLESAGLIAVDMRRTTADAFATEIPLAADHFPDEVVSRVRAHPDADTYQFVFRAIPAAGGARPELVSELVARNEELQALRAQVGAVIAAAGTAGPQHRVGLLVEDQAGPGTTWASLRTAVSTTEVRRRLDGLALTHVTTGPVRQPATWRGEPVSSLGPATEATAELVSDAYDALLLAGGGAVADAGALLTALAERGCPVVPVAVSPAEMDKAGESLRAGWLRSGPECPIDVRGPLSTVPDPLVLANRVIGGDALPLRREFLRISRGLPLDGDYLLVAVELDDPALAAPLGRVLSELGTSVSARVVIVPGPARSGPAPDVAGLAGAVPGGALLAEPTETDLLALVDGARLVITDSAAPSAVALSLRRPVLAFGADEELADLAAWCGDPDLVAATPAELLTRINLAVERTADIRLLDRVRAPLEMAYDELAAMVTGAAARRLSLSITEILTLQQTRIAALEQANMALQGRLVQERNALSACVAQMAPTALSARTDALERQLQEAEQRLADASSSAEEVRTRLESEMADLRRRAEQAQSELEATMATKTMRLLSPGRKLYGRIRHPSL